MDDFLPMIGKDDKDVAEAHLDKAKAKTAVLADEAEMSILELQELLGKSKVGTATRDEKDRLRSLNSKLSAMKKSIEAAKTFEKSTELAYLRSTAASKVKEVNLAMKERDVHRALLAVRSAESVDLVFILDCTTSMKS